MDDNDILANLEAQLSGLDLDNDEVSVRDLNDAELSYEFNEVRDRLINTGEMHRPRTQEGRDLHSRRAALLIEMRRRGWS